MRSTITISLPPAVKKKLDQFIKDEQTSRSDLVRDALRYYMARKNLERLRASILPIAQKQGFFSDEDVFEKIS